MQASDSELAPKVKSVIRVKQSYRTAEGLSARTHKTCMITLYLMGPAMTSFKVVDEAQLKDAGCEYNTEDATLITNSAESVESASACSNSSALQFEPREAVYLVLGDGSEMKLLLEKPYQNQSEVLGQIND